jgi:predicted PurR-regulated permease PerM
MAQPPALLLTLLLIVIPVIDDVLNPSLWRARFHADAGHILLGVIGGIVTYGLIGPFLGPVLLGTFYECLMT